MSDCEHHLLHQPAGRQVAGAGCLWVGWLAALAVSIFTALPLHAQIDREFLPRVSPFPPYSSPESSHYNLKWGRLTGRISASVQTEFNDNINLSETDPRFDISIGPSVGIGFLFPISKANVLQFDVGLGYRWYLNNPSVSSINILPNSRLEHNVYLHDVRINLHDYFSATSDPVTFGAISGGNASLLDFRRIHNTAGLSADWRASRKLGLTAGYDYSIDRSLSSQFTSLDRDDHTFTGGFDYLLSPRWTAGASGSYTFSTYSERIQNDGGSYSFGPVVNYKYSPFLIFDASAGFTVSEYDQTGAIGDTSAFRGFTYQFGCRHTINRRTSEDLRIGRRVAPGFNSNYSDSLSVQYGLRRQFTSAIWLHSVFAWELLDQSGAAGEMADRYLWSVGTSFRLTRHWSTAVAYTLSWKDSDKLGGDYVQNRLTLDISRQF